MRALPLRLDGQSLSTATHFLFIEKGKALLTTKKHYVPVPGLHGFQVKNYLILPGVATSKENPAAEFQPLRELLDELQPAVTENLAIGASLLKWDFVTQRCGVCGHELTFKPSELGKQCRQCEETFYPQIQPVAIVLVKRENELLLARGLAPRKHHSCLAGFVEVGETVEACIHREVKEEVGVEVENLRYFSSQSWPFPSNLMLAFTADYKSGEIKIDTNELTDAQWFKQERPPEVLPPRISIARQMIDSIWR